MGPADSPEPRRTRAAAHSSPRLHRAGPAHISLHIAQHLLLAPGRLISACSLCAGELTHTHARGGRVQVAQTGGPQGAGRGVERQLRTSGSIALVHAEDSFSRPRGAARSPRACTYAETSVHADSPEEYVPDDSLEEITFRRALRRAVRPTTGARIWRWRGGREARPRPPDICGDCGCLVTESEVCS